MPKELTNEQKLLGEISNPSLQGLFWVHSILTMMFLIVPVLCSGVNGEYTFGGLMIRYYQLPKYCPAAIFPLIAPFINAFVFSRKITFRKKFLLNHLTMITYLATLVISVVIAIRKISETGDVPLTIANQSFIFPATFLVNWVLIYWRLYAELEQKRRKSARKNPT